MISFIRNKLLSRGTEERKNNLIEQLDKELNYLQGHFNDKNIPSNSTVPTSCMGDALDYAKIGEENSDQILDIENKKCFQHTGTITKLCSDYGIIDKGILFHNNIISNFSVGLTVGSKVSYLAYKNPETDHIKVVKITLLNENNWCTDDEEEAIDQKVNPEVHLQNEKPKYYNTHERNILGIITERRADSLLIDVDYKILNVCLDSISLSFIPKEGDRVYVCCKIQTDDNFVDKLGEILDEVGIYPARLLKSEKCEIMELFQDGGALNKKAYFTNDILPNSYKPKIGDVLLADLIECEKDDFELRCIKCTVLEENDKIPLVPISPSIENRKELAVIVSPDATCIFNSTFNKQIVDLTCTNNRTCPFQCIAIDILPSRNRCTIRLVDAALETGFKLNGQETRIIQFEVEPKSYGHFNEKFVFHFENFRVTRSINIIACETAAETEAIEQSLVKEKDAEENVHLNQTRPDVQMRHYAYQVLSKNNYCVPGARTTPKRRFVAYRLPHFEIPSHLKRVYLFSCNQIEMLANIEQMYPCLKEDLCFNNYVNRFQTLIFLEEMEHFVDIRKYDRNSAYFTRQGDYLALEIKNLAERRPSLVVGDIVRVMNPCDNTGTNTICYDGIIHKVLCDRILLKFHVNFHENYKGEDYRVEFHFSRFPFRKQHYALQRVIKNLGEPFLFPTRLQKRDRIQLNVMLDEITNQLIQCDTNAQCPWYNDTLNTIQKKAIVNILRGEAFNMPYIIFGPPGTGKTMTLVETILQLITLLPSTRLLVAAPSNSAADMITTRLINSNVLKTGEFIRLVSQNILEKELIPENLMQHCATIDIAADGSCNDNMFTTESGLKLKCQMKYIGRHRVTIATCGTLGNFMQMDFASGHFTHVLIDECGQCTEPEAMIPISQVSRTSQVILTGDPRQLQAVIINRYASSRGIAYSFLERICTYPSYARDTLRFPETHGYDPRIITKLIYNYRSLPSILRIYNELFYESELVPMIDENSREAKMLLKLDSLLPESNTRSKTHGIFFYGMLSENIQDEDSPSWYNPCEAKNVFLMTLELYRRNISSENIGIITPYSRQVKHLRNLFITAHIEMPKIGSVEEFQGQERDIILISVVRSTKKYISNDSRYFLGFTQSKKRMNVAISRARYLLYVFGNPHILVLDQNWRHLIKYCVDNDAYLGCDLPDDFLTNAPADAF